MKVLVIDDDKDYSDEMIQLLKYNDLDGISVYSSKEAVEVIRNDDTIKIVICDIKLNEKIDGIELIKILKDIRNDLKIIIITAYSSMDTAIKSIKNGVFDYLKKPIEPEIIYLSLNNVIESIKKDEEIEKYKNQLEISLDEKQKELKKTNTILQTIIDNVPVGIWQCDTDKKLIFFNKKASQIMGKEECLCNMSYNPECEYIFKSFLEENEKNYDLIENIFHNKEEGEFESKTINGKWINIKYKPVYQEDKYIGNIGIILDITSKKIILDKLIDLRGER